MTFGNIDNCFHLAVRITAKGERIVTMLPIIEKPDPGAYGYLRSVKMSVLSLLCCNKKYSHLNEENLFEEIAMKAKKMLEGDDSDNDVAKSGNQMLDKVAFDV